MLYRKSALLKLVVKNSKCIFQVRNSSKSSGIYPIVLRKREDKLMFGKLLETKKQKLKRLKEEQGVNLNTINLNNVDSPDDMSLNLKKLQKTEQMPSTIDSELLWVKRTSSKLKIFNLSEFERNQLNLYSEMFQNSEKNNTIPKNDIKQNECETHDKIENKSGTKILSLEDSFLDNLKKENDKTSISETFLQQLTKFPILGTTKNINKEQWTDDTEIMSHSVYKDDFGLKYPSVTKILSATMSDEAKAILEKWKNGMIEKMGLEEFEKHQAETLEEGILFHSAVMNTLSKKDVIVAEKIKPVLGSLNEIFQGISKVRAIESDVVHPTLKYKGKLDCVADYRGTLCLIDWKKSSKKKLTVSSTFDAPFQMASYIGALNSDLKYPFQIKKGIIAVAYSDGTLATVHEIKDDLLYYYWQMWLQRLKQYYSNIAKTK